MSKPNNNNNNNNNSGVSNSAPTPAPAPAAPALKLTTAARFAAAGSAACIAETFTIPFDTVKVRLQIQANAAVKKYNGMLHCATTVISEEGPQGLFKGLAPGLLRQMVFATLRIGLYEPVRNFYHQGPGDPPLYKKILAALTTGTIGISIANPTDVVKVRLQAEGRLPPGVPRRYSGTVNAFYTIAKTEGITGLWRGVGPNIVRNSVINAAELATYDEVKQTVLHHGFKDNIPTHLFCAATAGFVATVVGSPVDVTKTRIMNQKINADGSKQYKNAVDCVVQIAKNEGVAGFYKGFLPNFTRIGSWNIVMFLAFEQLKIAFSTKA